MYVTAHVRTYAALKANERASERASERTSACMHAYMHAHTGGTRERASKSATKLGEHAIPAEAAEAAAASS